MEMWSWLANLLGLVGPQTERPRAGLNEKTEKVSPRVVETMTSLKAHADKGGSIEILPDGLRVCFLVLVDEAKANPTGLDALAAALDFKIGDLLRCFGEKWLRG